MSSTRYRFNCIIARLLLVRADSCKGSKGTSGALKDAVCASGIRREYGGGSSLGSSALLVPCVVSFGSDVHLLVSLTCTWPTYLLSSEPPALSHIERRLQASWAVAALHLLLALSAVF